MRKMPSMARMGESTKYRPGTANFTTALSGKSCSAWHCTMKLTEVSFDLKSRSSKTCWIQFVTCCGQGYVKVCTVSSQLSSPKQLDCSWRFSSVQLNTGSWSMEKCVITEQAVIHCVLIRIMLVWRLWLACTADMAASVATMKLRMMFCPRSSKVTNVAPTVESSGHTPQFLGYLSREKPPGHSPQRKPLEPGAQRLPKGSPWPSAALPPTHADSPLS
mmetsp:Transcript_12750/g.30330  ORF Transcript_12750/g.30330 Transcript_12750/m.30330 type:complete len:218 (-) Transcript_12750:240-893(-)